MKNQVKLMFSKKGIPILKGLKHRNTVISSDSSDISDTSDRSEKEMEVTIVTIVTVVTVETVDISIDRSDR